MQEIVAISVKEIQNMVMDLSPEVEKAIPCDVKCISEIVESLVE